MTKWQWSVVIAIIRILLRSPMTLNADKEDVDVILEALKREEN